MGVQSEIAKSDKIVAYVTRYTYIDSWGYVQAGVLFIGRFVILGWEKVKIADKIAKYIGCQFNDGEVVDLTKKEYAILQILSLVENVDMERLEAVQSLDELFEELALEFLIEQKKLWL